MKGGNLHNQLSLEKKRGYEERLWQRANEFSIIRRALEERSEELNQIFEAKPLTALNLHERDQRGLEESEYWETQTKISEIKSEEDKLEKALLDLSGGVAIEADLEILAPQQTEEERQISKRKQRILEEKTRLGVDPRGIMNEMYGEFGQEKMRLTTGRHATGVKNLGGMDPLSAANEFYYRTTDTHGGKVSHGKRGPSYLSSSGKRIRKK